MKKLLKKIAINLIGLLIVANITNGIDYQNNPGILAIAATALYVFNLLIRPLLNVVFLPINLLTLGASRWIINILIFWSVTFFVTGFKIHPISVPALTILNFSFSAATLSFFWSLVLLSFIVQLAVYLLSWLFD